MWKLLKLLQMLPKKEGNDAPTAKLRAIITINPKILIQEIKQNKFSRAKHEATV